MVPTPEQLQRIIKDALLEWKRERNVEDGHKVQMRDLEEGAVCVYNAIMAVLEKGVSVEFRGGFE